MPVLRGELDALVLAAPLFDEDVLLGELLADAVGIGVGLVGLVDRDDDRHGRRLRVADGLEGLRHDAVVGGDDQDHDVGDLGTACAHGGERLMARRIEERDLLLLDGVVTSYAPMCCVMPPASPATTFERRM